MQRVRKPSKQMIRLIAALCDGGRHWRHGYELMKATELASGTLYPLLMRMTEQGLVEAEWAAPEKPGRPARHLYRLTAAGLVAAQLASENDALPSGKAALA